MAPFSDFPPTPGRTGISRASTTGDLPFSSSVTSSGRISPFQGGRGGVIPTIPTSQLGSSEVSSTGYAVGMAPDAAAGDIVGEPPLVGVDSSQLEGSVSDSEGPEDPFA
jgi:hypothetical protein